MGLLLKYTRYLVHHDVRTNVQPQRAQSSCCLNKLFTASATSGLPHFAFLMHLPLLLNFKAGP